jgi:monoamine oxidase
MMGFIGGHEARVWERRPAGERRDAVLQQFAHFFGDEALSPTEVVEFNWSAEVWNRGCPVAVLGPGPLGGHGDIHLLGRLHGRSRALGQTGRIRSTRSALDGG